MDPELPDQGKQAEHVHVPDGIGPMKISAPLRSRGGKDLVKMRNSGDVPEATGQGACVKTALVVGDECAVESSGGAPPERILRILAIVQCQTRLTSSSITVALTVVKWNDGK